jgi:hypothetical protein
MDFGQITPERPAWTRRGGRGDVKALPEVVDKLTPNREIPRNVTRPRSSGRSSAASSRHAPGSL